jgi:predicted Zn finger-like uncharacterized protein
MNCTCTQCATVYRVDPEKIPAGGVQVRCSICEAVFRVEAPGEAQPTAAAPSVRAPSTTEPLGSAAAPAFGSRDPQARARRLARALVSDIVVYHPDRRDRSQREGTLRQEFREEIRKSWEEYVAQVGEPLARSTTYFRDALNEILAGGVSTF